MIRNTIAVIFLLAGLNVPGAYSQQHLVFDFTPGEYRLASEKPLKEILKEIQETYKVNFLFETKLEGLTSDYRVNPKKQLDQVLTELLSPFLLTSVRLNEKNYVIKTAHPAANKFSDSDDVSSGEAGQNKLQATDRNTNFVLAANTTGARSPSIYNSAPYADTIKLITINGIVTAEETNEPVKYASVSFGTKYFTTTDELGKFSISIPVEAKSLKISHVNYTGIEAKVKRGESTLNVSLKLRTQLADVTITTGMFDRRKESFTGAVSTYSGAQLKMVGTQNLLQSLKTLDPSFIVLENNATGSDPNKPASIEIRGPSSMPGTLSDRFSSDPNLPLFILDGFAVSMQVITDLDMNRVASVTILKDAASAALYGAQAANGVVVIETRQPAAGKLRVTYNGDFNVQSPVLGAYNMMNATEELEFERVAGRYQSQSGSYLGQDYQDALYNAHLMNVQRGVDTYWLDVPTRTSTTFGHSLFAETGDSVLRIGFGGNYRSLNGVMEGSGRTSYSAGMEFTYRKKGFTLNNKLYFNGFSSENSPYGSFKNFVGAPAYFPIVDSVTGNPSRYLEQSKDYNGTTYFINNPLYDAQLREKYGIDNSKNNGVINNLNLIYKFSRYLQIQGAFSFSKSNTVGTQFFPPELVPTYDPMKSGSYTSSNSNTLNYNGNLTLTYGKVFKNVHRFTGNFRTEIQESNSDYMSTKVVGFPFASNGNPAFAYGYDANGKPQTASKVYRKNNIIGSVNYVYDNRYFVDGTLRLDGSTAFGSNEKYQGFYAVGAGWNLSNEAFLKNAKWINTLRLRANTGISSNQSFGNTTSESVYTFNPFTYQSLQGLDLTSEGNPDLKWQITTQTNIGTDWVMFNHKLSLTANVFSKVTDPMVVALPVPPSAGGSSYVLNAGALHSKGWDINARYTLIQKPKQGTFWSVGFTWGVVKSVYKNFNNTLEQLNKTNQLSDPLKRFADGYSPDDLWAVRSMGIDPGTGQEIYLKKNGEYTFNYDPKDVVKVGSERPFAQGIMNTMFRWKGFTFNAAIRYNFGKDIFNSALFNKVENISYSAIGASGDQNGTITRNQDKRAFYDRWKNPGDLAQFKAIQLINPGYAVGTTAGPGVYTSRFVQRENYFSGESITLGYDANGKKWIKKIGLKNLRIMCTSNELFRVSTVQQERGTDYPFANTYSFSISTTF